MRGAHKKRERERKGVEGGKREAHNDERSTQHTKREAHNKQSNKRSTQQQTRGRDGHRVGGRDGQNNGVWLLDKVVNHFPNLALNVHGLVSHRHLCNRQVSQSTES
jgi:hypothetical protein